MLTVSERLTSPVALSGEEICCRRGLSLSRTRSGWEHLAHELAHLVRHDPAWLMIARLIETIFFFHRSTPLARRRMQEAAGLPAMHGPQPA
jgi:hypothetical protein